jgi:two-component system C4-dicarboxylate transport sensor histidine kinase DctB
MDNRHDTDTSHCANQSGRRRKAVLIAVGIWLFLAVCVAMITHYQAARTHLERADLRLQELAYRLEIELDRYRSLPKVLAMHPLLKTTLTRTERSSAEMLNGLLSEYSQGIASDAVYVIDRHGIAIASSNWQAQDSFIGVDYRFRPYYQQAIQGLDGSYFALGTVSGTRGYYFSHPVYVDGAIVGVLVIKVALSAIEKSLLDKDFDYVLTDVNGVIFFSSYTPWNYHSLTQLPDDIKFALIKQRKFGNNKLLALTAKKSFEAILSEPSVRLRKDSKQVSFATINRSMSEAGWRLFALVPTRLVIYFTAKLIVLFSVFYVLVCLVVFSWKRTAEARHELAGINEKLEHLVDERTIELRESNTRLREIIEKQQRTENTLKHTQNELIQAGKLAMLGEMAAGINHELNQPLTAMRIYIENMQTLVQRGELDGISQGAAELLKLNKMLAKIAGQYKIFSRKATGNIGPIRLAEIVAASIAIMDNKLTKAAIDFRVDDISPELQVAADSIPLEQIIINLLNNAIQAVSARPTPCIALTVKVLGDRVDIEVLDNGPGVDEQELTQLFEPFFTTKGAGLGLGLTISKRIVESFNGTIVARNRENGGASFCVSLPRYYQENQSESSK